MQSKATTINDYLLEVPEIRQQMFSKLRETIIKNLPKGFEETISYGMIGYVVPHSIYPKGYHCNPKLPLPFMNLASQKNFIALYHMGLYSDETLCNWFVEEYPKHSNYKLDMGKSCIRFKKEGEIPFELIAALVSKLTVSEYINKFESLLKK